MKVPILLTVLSIPDRYPGSAASERARRLQKALILAEDIDDERRAEKKREALERRKEMERERKKAIRAAYARQREAKKKKPGASADSKEITNLMHLYQEIEGYFSVKDAKQKKEVAAGHIYKTYLDPAAKKFAPLASERVQERLATEKDRPKSETLKEVQRAVLPKVEETFKEFLAHQSEEFGVDPQDLVNMSQAELAMRMGSDTSLYSNWQKRKGQSRGKNADPSDKDEEKKEKEDKSKIGTMQFTSVKVNVYEGGQEGRFARQRPASKSQEVKVNTERTMSRQPKVKSVSQYPIATIPEGQESEGVTDSQGDSQGTGSGLFSTDGPMSTRSLDTPSLLNLPSNRRFKRGTGKTTGRAQPSREDKNEFLNALGQSAAGHLSLQMLYFYKYLLKHGEEDGMPQLDKDLFFYIEVQKFKDCSHAFSDEEMLKRKVQSIVDCFLDSVYSPTLQVDIISEIHQKAMKAAQRYLGGKEPIPSLFDEAQFYVFKELLPYWAGFRKSRHSSEDPKKRPVTKYQKMLRKRMENIENYKMPSTEFILPSIPEGAAPSYTISLSEGVKYRLETEESAANTPLPDHKEHRGSRLTVAPSVENLSRRGRKNSIKVS
ncbi:hypothetical protein BaRGS_00020366 [Batillaria attramentaria]|uniref:RGS domain-containing protein n=1 Tax=Batillaria attramentaria TaxID=370345 RepID=A0ABD0KMP9_9CAEN